MGKRKSQGAEEAPLNGSLPHRDEEDDSGSDGDFDLLNVDFEWFDPQPEYDFHGIKTLLQQLFDVDAQWLEVSTLTDLILAQPLLGSTVKVDGNETDAYGFLSVLNLQEHHVGTDPSNLRRLPFLHKVQEKPAVSNLVNYLKQKASSSAALSDLAGLLSQPFMPPIGLILAERLINVPSEVVAPMFTMLLEEIEWALDEKEPYTFSHYLIMSKTYTEIASKLEVEDDRPKKKKKAASATDGKLFYFHPEDEVFQRHALCSGGIDYSTKQDDGSSDSKRAFQEMGIKPQGRLILIEAPKFKTAVHDVAAYLKSPE